MFERKIFRETIYKAQATLKRIGKTVEYQILHRTSLYIQYLISFTANTVNFVLLLMIISMRLLFANNFCFLLGLKPIIKHI